MWWNMQRITEIKQFFIRTGELTLEPGVYQYDFQVQLPTGIPTSLEAMHGHIRYGLQVVLDRPRWANQNFEATFTVIKPLNLNDDISLRVKIIFNYSNRIFRPREFISFRKNIIVYSDYCHKNWNFHFIFAHMFKPLLASNHWRGNQTF